MNKILIIEDEPVIKILKTKFELADFVVSIALDGAEALEKLGKEKPDIILLDILLPNINGFEFLEIVKHDKRFNNIPVVIFSNLGDSSNIEKSKQLGVLEYIIKTDVTMDDLVEKVKKHLK